MDYLELYPVRVFNPSSQEVSWELAAYAQVSDEDGFADLSEMYLIHDQQYLYWVSSRDEWKYIDQNGENWISIPRIKVNSSQDLPGLYRAVLIDDSGAQVEREHAVPQLDNSDDLQPSIRYNDDTIEIQGDHSIYRLSVYSAGGRHLASSTIEDPVIPFSNITGERGELSVYVNTLVPRKGYLFRTGPFIISRQP